MKRKMEKEIDHLASMTGAEFEKMFLTMMIGHHAMGIAETAEIIPLAVHAEVVGLGAKIIKAQSAEITMMQGWLCDWYGICPQ